MAPVDDNSPKKGKDEEEDPPIVVELKKLDDKCLEYYREYEKEKQALFRQYREKKEPFIKERATALAKPAADTTDATEDLTFGTPACREFWGQAIRNTIRSTDPDLDLVEDFDMDVLEYLKDITVELASDKEEQSNEQSNAEVEPKDRKPALGYKLKFIFVENPFFTNEVLELDYNLEEVNPYNGEIRCEETKSTTIDWKPGKDVTVEKAKKKKKSGKKSSKKDKEMEDRRSFFRFFFRSVHCDVDTVKDIELLYPETCTDEDDEDESTSGADEGFVAEIFLDYHMEIGDSIKDMLIPFAVRCYTGEVVDSDSDYDEDEEEESEEDDSDSDGSGKGRRGRKPAIKSTKDDKKSADNTKDEAAKEKKDPKQEECKQQ